MRTISVCGRKISGENNDRNMPVFRCLLQLPAKITAVGIRQFIIQQDKVRHKIPYRVKQLAAQRDI